MTLLRSLALVLLLLAAPLCAQSPDRPADKIAEALLRAGTAAEYPGADQLVVFDSTDVDVQESGLSFVLMHRLVRALTPAGARDLRNVVVGYDPLSAAVEIRLVRIIRGNGRIETLPASRIADYPAPARAIYWGAHEVLADVGRLEPGDGVETVVFRKGFTYALLGDPDDDDKYIPPMRGHFYDIVEFWSSVPVKEKVYRVFMPKSKPLQYEVYNGELQSSILFHPEQTGRVRVVANPAGAQQPTPEDVLHPTYGLPTRPGRVTYTWSKRDIAPFHGEPGMVSPSDVATKLLVSTSPDWYAKSAWFNKVNEDFGSFSVTPEVQSVTDSLLRGVTGELEKISVLNHWCAEEIRYSGISMGKGEGYTLHPGSMTMLDRCGVCKDKAGILVTMLRAAGFTSYPAMTMAGSRIDRIPADQFNHSVAAVRLKSGEWMLLDPTWIPGVREMWSSAEQQQEYLLGLPGGTDLRTTPVSPAENHYWKLTGTSVLDADGNLEGKLELTAEGQTDAAIRRQLVRSYKSSWSEYLPRLFAAVSPSARVLDQTMQDPYDLSKPMRITISYRIPGYAAVTSDRISFIPLLARNPFNDGTNAWELQVDTSLAARQYGFRGRCSKLVEIGETVTLPQGASVVSVPTFTQVKNAAGSFDASYTLKGNTLTMSSTHRVGKRVFDADDWSGYRAGVIERLRFMTTPVVLGK